MRVFLLVMLMISIKLSAQIEVNKGELNQTILAKDSLLFAVGFNSCDIQQFENILSKKFSFYHDQTGTSNKKQFIKTLKSGLCADPTNYQSTRVLRSTSVYPLLENGSIYGAVQEGIHCFYEGELKRSTAKFTHLWLLEKGEWKLVKALSFDHQVDK